MEYVYAAMLLHKAGKKIDETHLKKVLEAAGVKADASRVKALVAALESVNIDEAVKAIPVAQAAAQSTPEVKEVKEEKKPEPEKKKSEEEAAAGLGALFG